MGASKDQRLATALRRVELFKLKKAGADWDQIAAALGYSSRGAACKDYKRALTNAEKEVSETAEEMRALDISRLDRVQLGLWQAATTGDTKSADTVVRIIGMRARLAGYDSPPELAERIEQETIARVVPQMAIVWSQVLDGLGLTAEQRTLVPDLMDQAIRSFQAQQRPPRRRALDAGDDVMDAEEAA